MTQLGLPFDAPYPASPGHRRTATSRVAAERVKHRDKPLREQVLELLATGRERTADEIAAALGETVLSIRPRVAQLNKLGLIKDTGLTRQNESGLQATVWAKPTASPG